jgi:hypothetical protein
VKNQTKIIIATGLLLAAAFLLIRHQIGQPIECSHGAAVTPESRADEAALKETTWHKIFFTRSECRKLTYEESLRHGRTEMWSPD